MVSQFDQFGSVPVSTGPLSSALSLAARVCDDNSYSNNYLVVQTTLNFITVTVLCADLGHSLSIGTQLSQVLSHSSSKNESFHIRE